jgi:hypothetical protein
MSALLHLVWPTLKRETSEERTSRHISNLDDVAVIRSNNWSRQPDLALQEAKCLVDSELHRRRISDEKASTYLLVAAALIPLLTYLESAIWDQKAGTAPKWLSLPFLIVAVSYVVGTGFWAFKTLRVSSFVTLDATDLVAIWVTAKQIEPALAVEYLVVARRNRDVVNEKVGAIMLAHEFLLRAFFMFGALLLIESGWELAIAIRGIAAR